MLLLWKHSVFGRRGIHCCILDCAGSLEEAAERFQWSSAAGLGFAGFNCLLEETSFCMKVRWSWWRRLYVFSKASSCCEYFGIELTFGFCKHWRLFIPNDRDVLCPQTMNNLQQDPRNTGKFPKVTACWIVEFASQRTAAIRAAEVTLAWMNAVILWLSVS